MAASVTAQLKQQLLDDINVLHGPKSSPLDRKDADHRLTLFTLKEEAAWKVTCFLLPISYISSDTMLLTGYIVRSVHHALGDPKAW
jgi:hypothetical protein